MVLVGTGTRGVTNGDNERVTVDRHSWRYVGAPLRPRSRRDPNRGPPPHAPLSTALITVLSLLAVGACSSTSAGWTYTPAPPPTPVPSAAASGRAVDARLGRAVRRAVGFRRAVGLGRGAIVTIIASERRVHDAGRDGAREQPASRSRSTTRTRGSRTTSRSRTRSGSQVFKTDIFPGVEKRTFTVPALAAGAYTFALHGPHQHDRHADGAVASRPDDRRPASSSATRMRTRGPVEARVVAVESGEAPPGHSSTGRCSTRAAAGSRRTAGCCCARPTADRGPSGRPQVRWRDRP